MGLGGVALAWTTPSGAGGTARLKARLEARRLPYYARTYVCSGGPANSLP